VAQPRIEVTAPARRPLRGGLSRAVQVRETFPDGTPIERLALSELFALSDACHAASCSWPAPCSGDVPPQGGKATSDCCPMLLTAQPFTVWAAQCTDLIDPVDAEARARAKLTTGQWQCVESQLWDFMAASATDVSPPGGSATGVAGAISALEAALGKVYDGAGIIHAPLMAAAMMGRDYQLCGECADDPTTWLGNRVAFGNGYTGNGPQGQVASPCVYWLYATSAADVYQTPILRAGANDLAANSSMWIAERSFAVLFDCPGVFAARVTDCCDCEAPADGPAITAASCA